MDWNMPRAPGQIRPSRTLKVPRTAAIVYTTTQGLLKSLGLRQAGANLAPRILHPSSVRPLCSLGSVELGFWAIQSRPLLALTAL